MSGALAVIGSLLGSSESDNTNDSNSYYYDSGLLGDVFGSAGDPGGTIANMITGMNQQKKAGMQQAFNNQMAMDAMRLEKDKFNLTNMLGRQEWRDKEAKRKWKQDFQKTLSLGNF